MVDHKALRELHFFSDLSDEELDIISKIIGLKKFSIGETIFKEGENGKALYIIKKGEVKACKMASDGELFTLALMREGEIFGEMSFLDGRPRSATIVATSDVEIYMIEKQDFDTLIDHNPRIIYKLLKNIIFTIHSIVKGMNTRYMEMLNYMWGRRR
ncbi:MAG: cyclic nucleotide-binding domain-containing protein [Deltaproteobacteria bacterium]|nr:cyclic nucleotide-binding domain-containing protein [Deltaproteobacteria bacterium]